MDNLVADFIINIDEPLQAEFVLGNSQTFDCSFELFAAGTVWGSIDGDITNQTDLQNALNLKADRTDLDADVELINQTINENYNDLSGQIEDLETVVADNYTALENDLTSLSTTVDNNYSELSNRLSNDEQTTSDLIETVADNYTELNGKISTNTGNITSIQNTINSYGNIVSYNATDFATASQGALADTALQSGDNITELVNNAGYITSADLPTLEDLTTQAQMNAINSGATSVNIAQIASNTQAISTETLNRQNADNGLQSQIDAIVASSDVFDIVGTYAELQAYDISTVPPNDIIKVLVDSTHNNAATYYRCVETGGVKSWSYIGSEGAYYTKSEADGRFVPLERTINGKALSSNITLDATDVGALPSSTVIPTVNNGTLTIQVNGTSVGTFTANQSGNTTANIVVPDSATWGNITGDIADQTDLQDALDEKQDTLVAGTDLEIIRGSSTHNLPEGYTEVEYIQANGNAGIITSVAGNINTNVTLIANCTQITYASQVIISDGYDGNGGTYFGQPSTKNTWGAGGSGSQITSLNVLIKTEFNISSTVTTTLSLNGTVAQGPVIQTFSRAGTVSTTGNYTNWSLFGSIYKNNNTIAYPTYGKVYYAKFEQNNTVVAEYIPAIRNSDNAVGLYDIINNTFIARNLGTGTLIAGEKVADTATINFTNETGYITGIDSTDVTTALGYTPVNPSNLATVATSGDYDDLTNKPTIPTVGDGTITITQGGVTKGTFTTNQSGNSTIALDAGSGGGTSYNAGLGIDITNDTISIDTSVVAQLTDIPSLTGYATETWVTSQGYLTSSALTNYVTTDTAQDISGRKTFLGEKAIYFKQNATSNKLGFTLYNPSSTELGAFEYRPNTISGGALLNVNVPYSSSDYVGFRYWGTAVNIIAPKVATAGDYYIPVNITDGNTTVTANSSGTVNISSLLPNVSGYLENTATGTDSLTILGTATTNDYAMNIGIGSSVTDDDSIAIGQGASVSGADSLGIGRDVDVSGDNSIQLGNGTLTDDDVFQVWNYPLLDYPNGEIFAARIPSSIARTSQIPTVPTNISAFTNDSGYITSSALSGYATETWVGQQGFITSASLPTMTYTSATETLAFG